MTNTPKQHQEKTIQDIQDAQEDDTMQAIIAAWPAAEVAPSFSQRVVAAMEDSLQQKRRRIFAVTSALIAAVLVVSVVSLLPTLGSNNTPSVGELVATQRTTISVADRGLAVAEQGTRLNWKQQSGGTIVAQRSGNVFYRIDTSEDDHPFYVEMHGIRITVVGTCFRVEEKPLKPIIKGSILGAAMATTVVVTVYEGKVSVARIGAHTATMVEAGNRVTVSKDQPIVAAKPILSNEEDTLAVKGDLSAAQARIADLEQEIGSMLSQKDKVGFNEGANKVEPWELVDPSQELLDELAKNCSLHINTPASFDSIDSMGSKVIEASLTEEEIEKSNDILARLQLRYQPQLRDMYEDLTGDIAPSNISFATLVGIAQFDLRRDGNEDLGVARKLAEERAGWREPVEDDKLSHEAIRLGQRLSVDYHKQLVDAFGATKAKEFVKAGVIDSHKVRLHGCNEKSGNE